MPTNNIWQQSPTPPMLFTVLRRLQELTLRLECAAIAQRIRSSNAAMTGLLPGKANERSGNP